MPMKGSYSKNMTNGSSVYGGTARSISANAPMDSDGGNYGKPIGDTGKKSKKGNRKTRRASDRYI